MLTGAIMTTATTSSPLDSDGAKASTPADRVIRLAATISIRDSNALKQTLLPLLQSQDPVVIDVSDVTHIDTAALQLLFAFSRDRRSSQRALQWLGDSTAWRNAVATFNSGAGTAPAFTNI